MEQHHKIQKNICEINENVYFGNLFLFVDNLLL